MAPAPGGLVGLLSGDATDALAQMDLLRATSGEDAATLARFRVALADQEASVARLARVRARRGGARARAGADEHRCVGVRPGPPGGRRGTGGRP